MTVNLIRSIELQVQEAEHEKRSLGRRCGCNEATGWRFMAEQLMTRIREQGGVLLSAEEWDVLGRLRAVSAEEPDICCDRGLETGHRGKCQVAK